MSDHWAELWRLFDELVELEADHRESRLREIGARDAPLRDRLEAMLAADIEHEHGSNEHEQLIARSIVAAADPRAASDPLGLIGTRVGRYRVDALLGAGGMGVVYRSTDVTLGRDAALKFLPPALSLDAHAKQRFLHEARAASSLDHTNVCTIYEADETADGTLYIAMAFYAGETLRDRLDRGLLDIQEALDLTIQAARGLAAAHTRGLVHRDIKPANLLVTADGILKILDFGVAKAADVGLTLPEQRPGTLGYMAPEQARGETVGVRADLWSLGVVLYQMLTGRRPAAAGHTGERVAPPSALRPGVPAAIDALVLRLLEHEPRDRPANATEVVRALERETAVATAAGGVTRFVRDHPALSVVLSAGAVLLAFAGGVLALRQFGPSPVAAEPLETRIQELVSEQRFIEAFQLAEDAEEEQGTDPLSRMLWYEIADWITVTTEPEGARVLASRYPSDGSERGEEGREWQTLGTTPLDSVRVARGEYIIRVELDGYAAAERSASSALERVMPAAAQFSHRVVAAREWEEQGPDTEMRFHIPLVPDGNAPGDMVFVPGGPYELVSQDVAGRVELDAFLLDRFEVTNAQFAEFIRAGGYTSSEHWQELRVDATDDWQSTLDGFTDRTGLPAPRNWTGQLYAEELADHPVTSMTWYEAAAYCRFRGRRLPTLFEWEKAARAGLISRFDGRIMPWGYHTQRDDLRLRANFSGTGTELVDAHPFGMSPYGAYGMAGNAKEWVSNPSGSGRVFAGGSWEDPVYLFGQVGSNEPLTASPALGFRCATLAEPGAQDSMLQGDGLIELDMPTPVYEPVDEQTFQTLLSHYRYDPVRLDAEVLETIETPGWIREKVAFNGPAGPVGNRILAYLYLPRVGQPPFQTLVYTPGAGAFLGNTLSFETEWVIAPLIRAGRAAFTVVMSGMTEREWRAGYQMPEPSSVAFRDLMVLHATELRIGLDYLETRAEIDTTAIAYVGMSMGAGSRLPWAAVDDRFHAVILLGGGIDERVHPTLPEASNINFAPYIQAPKLLLNGRNDEDHRWESRARPLWNLLTEPKDLVLVEGAGHLVPPERRIPAMVDWLDRTLGPARH